MKWIVLSFVLALIGVCCCAQLGNKVSRKALPDSTLIKNILNPISIDIEADMYFAPTNLSRQNLLNEGKDKNKIYVTGNTVVDAMATTVDEK